MSKPLRWQPSKEGYTVSHCGRYSITPEYWGRCNATSYRLTYKNPLGKMVRAGTEDTQKACKARAQHMEDNRPS